MYWVLKVYTGGPARFIWNW